MKSYVQLVDDCGEVWAAGEFSKTVIIRLIKSYARAGVILSVLEFKAAA